MIARIALRTLCADIVDRTISQVPYIHRYFIHIKSEFFQLAIWWKVIAGNGQRASTFLTIIVRAINCIAIITGGTSFTPAHFMNRNMNLSHSFIIRLYEQSARRKCNHRHSASNVHYLLTRLVCCIYSRLYSYRRSLLLLLLFLWLSILCAIILQEQKCGPYRTLTVCADRISKEMAWLQHQMLCYLINIINMATNLSPAVLCRHSPHLFVSVSQVAACPLHEHGIHLPRRSWVVEFS